MIKRISGNNASSFQEQIKKLDLLPCGGKGICGKCRVHFLQGAPLPSKGDRSVFLPEELRAGYRLACQAKPNGAYVFEVACGRREKIEIVLSREETEEFLEHQEDYIICVDIGTTTIAMEAVSVAMKRRIACYTKVNPQRQFGADVISRITAAMEGHLEEMQDMLQTVVKDGVNEIMERLSGRVPKEIRIAGNTTMEHIFLGLDPKGLGSSPFIPVTLEVEKGKLQIGKDGSVYQIPYVVMPGVSAFFGGDALIGLTTLEQEEKNIFFIDLGTNGEMALLTGGKVYVTSVAAGSAFDGGALEDLWGSDLILCVAEALKQAIIDPDGTMENDRVFMNVNGENIQLTRQDIRSLQLAKAAVATGIDMLLKKAELQAGQIDQVVIAGGMGMKLPIDACIRIGMVPKSWREKIVRKGNTALEGLALYQEKKTMEMRAKCMPINLANEEEFQERFMRNVEYEHQGTNESP